MTVQLTSGTKTYQGSVDLRGEYLIPAIPEGTYELWIDGSTAMEPDGSRVKELSSLRIEQFSVVLGAMPFGTEVLTLPEIGASLQVELDEFRQGVILAGTELAIPDGGPALRFVRSAVVTFPEGSSGILSISESRPESSPAAFYSDSGGPIGGLLLQPTGVSFDFPPSSLLPNRAGLAPNTGGVSILGLSPNGTGVTVVGTGTVDPDGRYILPDPAASLGETRELSSQNSGLGWLTAWFSQSLPLGTVTGTVKDTSGTDLSDVAVIVQGYTTRKLTALGHLLDGGQALRLREPRERDRGRGRTPARVRRGRRPAESDGERRPRPRADDRRSRCAHRGQHLSCSRRYGGPTSHDPSRELQRVHGSRLRSVGLRRVPELSIPG